MGRSEEYTEYIKEGAKPLIPKGMSSESSGRYENPPRDTRIHLVIPGDSGIFFSAPIHSLASDLASSLPASGFSGFDSSYPSSFTIPNPFVRPSRNSIRSPTVRYSGR